MVFVIVITVRVLADDSSLWFGPDLEHLFGNAVDDQAELCFSLLCVEVGIAIIGIPLQIQWPNN